MERKLHSPKVMKEVLEKYKFKFSKGLGQNFLIDGNILSKICDGAEITDNDYVVEVGPGIGVLTQFLCERAKKVVAVELDQRLIPILENDTLSEYDNFEVVHGDILKIDLNKLIEDKLDNQNIKIAANLPYYITTPIIMKILESDVKVDKMVVMVQKEVALRMQADPGTKDYGALSVAVQYYSDPKIIVDVPSSVFMPRPNVDSAVILLDIYKQPPVEVEDKELMFKVVKAAFGKRRKTLVNSLSLGNIGLTKEEVKEILTEADIDHKIRGEKLSIEDFAKLSNLISCKNK